MADAVNKRLTPVTPQGINHLVLNVHDMDESHHFWSDLLGFRHVGTLRGDPGRPPLMPMRFYSGVVDDVNHHDLALVERPGLAPRPEQWDMVRGVQAINHIAITYPDRESWLEQVQFLIDQDWPINERMDHGMTHSLYINDPNGYGVEVLYDLPREVWGHDIEGALSHAVILPKEDALVDDTNYETNFT